MHGTQELLDLAEQPKGDLPQKLVRSRLRDVMVWASAALTDIGGWGRGFRVPRSARILEKVRARGRLVERRSGVGWWRRPRRLLERARASWALC